MRAAIKFLPIFLLALSIIGCKSDAVIVDEAIVTDGKHDTDTDSVQTKPQAEPESNVSVLPLEEYIELPPNCFVEEMEVIGEDEIKLTLRDSVTNRSYYAQIDMDTKKMMETGNAEDHSAWEAVSPTGEWTAVWGRSTPGIWGIPADSSEKIQWTLGEGDWSPSWQSDGSGFYYLHATGNSLGDGAGPERTLAHFDIDSGKTTVLPFEKGFWGGIHWLKPDESLVAFNGFDDVFGVKIVNLSDSTEEQILDTSDFEYVDVEIHPTKGQLLVSDHGKMTWYDSQGDIVGRQDWPVDFDEYTKKNPQYAEGGNPYEQPYYEKAVNGGRIGPQRFQFSPDGRHLAYLLGAVGSSMDDKIPGVNIVVSRDDGTHPIYVLKDYARVHQFAWNPSSDRLFVVFSTDEVKGRIYIGELPIGDQNEGNALPETLAIEYQPVSLSELVEEGPDNSWQHLKSIPFGTFSHEPVVLHVYKEAESFHNRDILRGVFEIQRERYRVPDELSSTLLEEESEFNRNRLFLLQRNFPAEDGPYHLLGSFDLFANGPGRMMYLLHNRVDGKWKFFEEWGTPMVSDLDRDGNDELIVQFPGLHLSPPNVALFSLHGNQLEMASVTEQVSNGERMSTTLQQDTNPWRIRIGVGEVSVYEYIYEDKKLIRAQYISVDE